jgi:hypothetical protein
VEELQFLETADFRKWVRKNRLQSAVTRLRADLAGNRLLGDVIPGGDGLRKVRMAGAGRGKSGGFRVVYVLLVNRAVAVLMDGYSKSEKENLSADELAGLVAQLADLRAVAAQLIAGATEEE